MNWNSQKCIQCGKYHSTFQMVKVVFKTSNSSYGFLCKTCYGKTNYGKQSKI